MSQNDDPSPMERVERIRTLVRQVSDPSQVRWFWNDFGQIWGDNWDNKTK